MRKELRPVFFTAPEADIRTGGYSAEVDAMNLVKEICDAELLTYEKRCPGFRYLDDVVHDDVSSDAIFIVHWGPSVPSLVRRLKGRNVVYHAHSTGYGFTLPVEVPIIAASKHTMAYWGAKAACSVLYYVPLVIPNRFSNLHGTRDIDVLVQERKSSKYLMKDLVPTLQQLTGVTVLQDWVEDMAPMFNRAKVYLYDSTDHWHNRGVSEGFGLPPLEAIACGCTVFSSVNHGLSDYLKPGFNAHKIRSTSLDYDVKRICRAVETWKSTAEEPSFLREYRTPGVIEAWKCVLTELNTYFDARVHFGTIIDPSDRLKKTKPYRYMINGIMNRLRSLRTILSR
jgi:hypothetical protein